MNENKSAFVVIETVQGQMTAEIIKSHLEDEGIPVYLQSESVGRVYGLIMDGLGAIKILVPLEFAEEAKKIIKDNAPLKPEE
jgi:CRISPR/Cas system-associated protein Csm6